MSRKLSKVVLIINAVLFFPAAVMFVVSLSYEELVSSVAMFLVMLVACYNVFVCWRNLKRNKQE